MSPKFGTILVTKQVSREQRYCAHTTIEVDKETRQLQCQACKVWLDPFEFLWRWAQRREVVERRLSGLREEEVQLCARIIELKKEERRVKARLKNANKKIRES